MTENRPYVSPRNDQRSTDELITAALDERNEDAAQYALGALRLRGTLEVLEAARGLCRSDDPDKRWLGAAILGQLGNPEMAFCDERFQTLIHLLETEEDGGVLAGVACALGHLHDPRAIEQLIRFKNHPNASVRHGVAFGILGYENEIAVSTLIELSSDKDEEVRSWATFGLGTQINTDNQEIREALADRLSDPHDETRGEALVGLARRKDPRVIDPLIKELSSETVGSLAVEAAEEIGDPKLYPVLTHLREWWDVDPEQLQRALEKCEPRGQSSSPAPPS